MDTALLCGQRMKSSISFRSFILCRTVCKKPYFKLKVQELLLFLCMVDVTKEKQREMYTSPQVEIVKEIHKKLVSNLQERPTIEELSKEYLINTATLKPHLKAFMDSLLELT